MSHKTIAARQRTAERHAKAVKYNAEQFALALTRTLSEAPFQGTCKCGLMLTERDVTSRGRSRCCPRCGWTGEPQPTPGRDGKTAPPAAAHARGLQGAP